MPEQYRIGLNNNSYDGKIAYINNTKISYKIPDTKIINFNNINVRNNGKKEN